MDAQRPTTQTNTCQFVRNNGELCKRRVAAGEHKCWEHAGSLSQSWKSLTRNQHVGFALVWAGVILGLLSIPSLYFSYVSWRDSHPKLTAPSPPVLTSVAIVFPVSVVPKSLNFASEFIHDNYIFTISNDTDKDQYQVEVAFKIADSSMSFKDFSVEIPASSRKPIIDGSRILDISGLRGSDASGHSILLLSIHRLKPRDVREVSFTRNKPVPATVTAAYTYSTEAPQPRVAEPNKMMETYHLPGEPATFVSMMTFLANGTAEPKSVTVGIQKNKGPVSTATTPFLSGVRRTRLNEGPPKQ